MVMLEESIKQALLKKMNEFHCFGYTSIDLTDIHDYFFKFLWKRQEPQTVDEKIGVIQMLTPNQLFDYKLLQIQAMHTTELSDIRLDELI